MHGFSLRTMSQAYLCGTAVVAVSLGHCLRKTNSIIEVTKKAIDANDVYLLSIASIVRPLLLPKKVSAPPAMTPEMPDALPDCSSTITIIEIENITCKMFTIIAPAFILSFSLLTRRGSPAALFYNSICCMPNMPTNSLLAACCICQRLTSMIPRNPRARKRTRRIKSTRT